jgi:GNAT superfamily N-acetyltransferase
MKLRDATLDDVPALLALGQRMHAESPRFSLIEFDSDRLQMTLEQILAAPGGFLMVGEHDSAIAGVMVALATQHWCSRDIVASEMALFVEPEFRGSMLGARLIRRYVTWARALGARLVTAGISTGVHVEETARLYEAVGMRRFGVLLEA